MNEIFCQRGCYSNTPCSYGCGYGCGCGYICNCNCNSSEKVLVSIRKE